MNMIQILLFGGTGRTLRQAFQTKMDSEGPISMMPPAKSWSLFTNYEVDCLQVFLTRVQLQSTVEGDGRWGF